MLPSLSKLTLKAARKVAPTSDAIVTIDNQSFWMSEDNEFFFNVPPTDPLFWQYVKRLEEGDHVIQHEGPNETEEIFEWKRKTHIWILNTIGKEARNAYINADTNAEMMWHKI